MRKAFSIFILVILTGFVIAQEPLSLSEAIATGLQNNYDIVLIQKNIEIAENNNNQGQAGRYPSLSIGVNQNNNGNDQIVASNPFQPRGVIISSGLTPSARLDWTIFEGFKVNITKKRLDKLQLESEGNASIVISNTIQAIIFSYYMASLENERLKVFERSLSLSQDRFKQMKLRKQYGSANTSDMLLEEGNYLTDSISYINQELAYRNAIRALNNLLAVEDLDRQYSFTDSIQVDIKEFNMTDLESKMLEKNIDLKTKYLSQSIVKYDLKLAQSERYPKLTMGASTSYSRNRVDQSNALFFDQTTGDFVPLPAENQQIYTSSINYGLNFSLTYNLFNGHRIHTAIKNAKIREDIGNIQIDQMTMSLKKDLRDNYDSYQIRSKIYKINDRMLETAALNLKISGDRFKLGAINSIDYRVVQLNYLNASMSELNARYGLLESKLALMRLTGGILEVYQ